VRAKFLRDKQKEKDKMALEFGKNGMGSITLDENQSETAWTDKKPEYSSASSIAEQSLTDRIRLKFERIAV
jgi:hypothetical protein